MFKYGAVFHGTTIVAEYPSQESELHDIAAKIITKMDITCPNSVVEQGRFLFMSYNNNDLASFACLCDKAVATFQCKEFLDKLKSTWITKYGSETSALNEGEKTDEFGPDIASIISNANSKQAAPVADPIPVPSESSESHLYENPFPNVGITETLNPTLPSAYPDANIDESLSSLRCRICWNRYGKWIAIILSIILIIYIIIAFACGGLTLSNC